MAAAERRQRESEVTVGIPIQSTVVKNYKVTESDIQRCDAQ